MGQEPVTRREDWPARLGEAIDAARVEPFEYGRHDCALWVGTAIEAITGEDPTAPYRGRYTTEIGWKRLVTAELGEGATFEAGWTRLLGEPVPVAMAGRGDVVMIDQEGERAVGVVDLSGERVACVSLDGIEFVPLSLAVTAWKV